MEIMATSQNLLNEKDLSIESLSTIRRFQKSMPVDIVGIAEAFGLKVYEDDLPVGVSGKIIKDEKHGGKANYSIVINAHEPTTRKRFTIAHEISHYLLHKEDIGNGLTDDALYRSGLSTLAEVHANRLAAEILMPFTLIEEAINKGSKSINELSKVLQVSPQAMSVRLAVPG
jgi:Zn-dependent peptidase ImmA (M78 family)